MLQSYAVTAVLQVGLIIAFGWVMLPFLAVHNVVAWWQLTSANAIGHLADVSFSGTSFAVTLPAQSVTLFVVPASGTVLTAPTRLRIIR